MPSDFDAVIVGGGAAGLAAARVLAHAGVSVAILDENVELGGQFFRRRAPEVLARHGDHRPFGSRLVEAVRGSGATCFTETVAWGAEGRTLWTSDARGSVRTVTGRTLLLATGAYERSIPFPGWTLPGVCTPGLATHMASADVVPIGQRIVVAGSGPFLLSTACALLEAGSRVAAVFEYHSPYKPSIHAFGALRHARRLVELAGYFRTLRRHGVRLYQNTRVVDAVADRDTQQLVGVNVERVDVPARRRFVGADCLCIGYGFVPSTELARLIGCRCVAEPLTGDLIVDSDQFGATSVPGVFVAGELQGVAGAEAALVRGRLAAHGMLLRLGHCPPPAATAALIRDAQRLDGFAALLARLFPVPVELFARISDATVVCRCEHITAAALRETVRLGWNDINSVKGATRAGMGLCQGRMCGPVVRALVAGELRGRTLSGLDGLSTRVPLKPIPFPVGPDRDVAKDR